MFKKNITDVRNNFNFPAFFHLELSMQNLDNTLISRKECNHVEKRDAQTLLEIIKENVLAIIHTDC